jgi:hypothetical protein
MKQRFVKTRLSMFEAWNKLLCGEVLSSSRISDRTASYLRRQAQNIGRQLVDSGMGAYRTYSLS